MRYVRYILVMSVLCFTFSSHADEVLDSYKKISEVIKRVQAGERKALDDLMKIALGEHPLELSDKIKATVIYGLTTANDTKKLNDFLDKIGMKAEEFYTDKKFHTGCKACEGEGHSSSDCKNCVFGKCKNCKGTGVIEYKGLNDEIVKSVCPKCQGSKKCVPCEGSGEMQTDCPSCNKGNVFDRSSVFSEYVNSVKDIDALINQKINQMQTVDSVTETEVKEDTKVSSKSKIEEELDIKQTLNENKQDPPDEVKEEKEEDKDNIEDITDVRLENSFNEVKRLIENHENKHNQKICNEIKFKLEDDVPTMVLNLNDSFYKNIGESDKDIIHNFEKFWEARAFLNGYKGKVEIKLINNDKNVNKLLNKE